MNLDSREFEFWIRESDRVDAVCKIDGIQIATAPHMESRDYKDMMKTLIKRAQLEKESQQEKEQRWAAGRAALLAKVGRRKKK